MPENGEGKTTRIGGYEILGRLGQGGMGAVYKARQVSMDRVVALKVLPPRLAKDEAFVQRFVREARSAAKLQHPNIVQGIDVGVADGYYYFAMEFVDGPTVKQLVAKEGTLDEKRALGIARSVAVALAHAHEHGIIHRDVKPSNILLTAKGEPKLADLGLARRVEEAGSVTLEGTALGTPYCMAPEQVRGLPDVDIRADIYALGATLHYLLAGAFPYDGPTASAIMMKHVTDPVPSARTANPEISRACGELIARMMAKAPNDRPQTPTDLLSDIDDALAGKVTLRPGPRSKTRTLASARKHPKPRAAPPNVGGVGARAEAPRGLPRVLPKNKAAPWLFAGAGLLLLTIIVVWLATRGGGKAPPEPPPDRGRIAFQAAEAFESANRDQYDRAIAHFEAVARDHPGTAWARHAADRIKKLKAFKAAAVAVAAARQRLEAALTALQPKLSDLMGRDRFGDALSAIDALAKKHGQSTARPPISVVRKQVTDRVEKRFIALRDAADAALAAKEYAKARDALQRILAFGLRPQADYARRRLAEIDQAEKGAEHLAKWDTIKAQAAKLVEAGKYGDALKLLDTAKAIPLDDIADRIADERALVEDAQRDLLEKARAAYAVESDKVWDAFKSRKYADADRLLAALAKRPEFSVGGVSTPREGNPAAWRHAAHNNMLAADRQAAALLRAFWAAVAEGLKLKTGQFLAFAGAGGNIASVKDGKVTLRTPRGEQVTLPLDRLDAKRALANALLKTDARAKLIEAVFLLAEATDTAAAAQALAAAGDAPHLAHYRDRLDALRLGAAEHAARRAWQQIQRYARGEATRARAKHLLGMLDTFNRLHGGTQVHATTREDRAAIRARVAEHVTPPQHALEFGGQGEDVLIPYRPAYAFTDGFTVEAWFAFPAEGKLQSSAVAKVPAKGRGGTFVIGTNPDGNLDLRLAEAGGGAWQWLRPAEPATRGRWLHVALTYDGQTGIAYIDGRKVAESRFAGALNQDNWPIHIGHHAHTGAAFHGRICEVRLWRVARSADAIRSHMKRRLRGTESGLVGYWPFTEGKGNVLHDRSPQRNHATITGAKWVRVDDGPFSEKPQPRGEAPKSGEWQSLFDGKSLRGWRVIPQFSVPPKYGSGKAGDVRVQTGQIRLGKGDPCTGIRWTEEFPTVNYEVSLEAKRTAGRDSLCVVLFPVREEHCELLVGGYEAGVRLQRVAEDGGYRGVETARSDFANDRWYQIRLRVTQGRIEAWVDRQQVADFATAGRRFAPHAHFDPLKPFGLRTWNVESVLRNIRLRRLGPEAEPRGEAPKAGEWQSLFDGKSLRGWRVVEGGDFARHGRATARDGRLVLGRGEPRTGVAWTRDFPETNYEVELDAMRGPRRAGLCRIVFPVGSSHCMLSPDELHAETGLYRVDGTNQRALRPMRFAEGRWYRVRLRVTQERIEAWIDRDKIVDQPTAGHEIALYPPYRPAIPFALCTMTDEGAVRNIRLRRLRRLD